MNRKFSFIAVIGLALIGTLNADPIPQPQVIFAAGPGVTWTADWQGVATRTYFTQWSTDLVTWSYFPSVRFGTGIQTQGGLNPASKFFFRLKYADEPWVTTLQEARDADFDRDGIPNLFEVETLYTDPFDINSNGGDSDGDGLADGWERYHFSGNLTTANGSGNPDGDSLSNAYEAALGTDPNAGIQAVADSEVQLFIPREP